MPRNLPTPSLASRTALIAAACLLASACGSRDEPAIAAPTPMPPATGASPATVARPAVLLSYSIDDGAIGTEVGARLPGAGMATSGKEGWLMFGPYVPLPAGRYRVAIHGLVEAGHAGTVHVDVARDKGGQLIAAAEIEPDALVAAQSSGALVDLPFVLEQDVSDLEVRIRVTDQARLSIASYQIQSVP